MLKGEAPPYPPIWQEHPIRSDLEKIQHKHLTETLLIAEVPFVGVIYYNFKTKTNLEMKV